MLNMIFECLIVAVFVASETLGNTLLYLLAVFEKYGMDLKKRTVVNQLVRSICIITILDNLICMPIIVARMTGTPLGRTIYFPLSDHNILNFFML